MHLTIKIYSTLDTEFNNSDIYSQYVLREVHKNPFGKITVVIVVSVRLYVWLVGKFEQRLFFRQSFTLTVVLLEWNRFNNFEDPQKTALIRWYGLLNTYLHCSCRWRMTITNYIGKRIKIGVYFQSWLFLIQNLQDETFFFICDISGLVKLF